MSETLIDRLRWAQFPIPATTAAPTIALHVGTVGNGAPVGLIVAGQHGDEGPWGTRAIRKLLETTPASELRGTLRVVPVANPLAFAEKLRTAHIDGDDVNMEFPGDPGGKHTQRLAHTLAVNAVDGTDLVLDVHGGGSWCVNCFVYRFPGSHELAEQIGAPFIRDRPERGNNEFDRLCNGARRKGSVDRGWRCRRVRRTLGTPRRRRLAPSTRLRWCAYPGRNAAPTPAFATGAAVSLRTSAPGLYLPVLRDDDVAR